MLANVESNDLINIQNGNTSSGEIIVASPSYRQFRSRPRIKLNEALLERRKVNQFNKLLITSLESLDSKRTSLVSSS